MHQVSVRDCRDEDRRWIASVYRDYVNDLAASATGLFPALPEVGHREPDQLQSWFADTNARVLAVLYGEEPVGFAKIRMLSAAVTAIGARSAAPLAQTAPGPTAESSEFSMAEFFIARPWRRRGIGAQAVRLILDRFAGRWLITELLRNDPAVRFWRQVVGAYTSARYQEAVVDGEVRQRFLSGTRRRS